MTLKKRIAIDARELTKKNLNSLGYILIEIMAHLNEYEIFLFSDIDVPEQYIPSNATVISRNQEYKGGIDLYKFQRWMKRRMMDERIDVYFQINHFSVTRTKGIKQIVIVHDLYPLENIEKNTIINKLLYRISMIGTMLFSDKIFTVSNFTKHRLEHFFWKSSKIEVDYNGIDDPPKITDLESFKCIDEPFLLMLGRVNHYKGTLRIVELYDKYLSDCGYKLIIAGQATSEESGKALKNYIKKNPNIVWLDYVTNETKEWLLRNCALFIYSSRYDGFGLPPLEAAIRKKKVIINDIEVLREVSQNSGHYVDFYSTDHEPVTAIKNEIATDDKEQINKMFQVAKTYTWDSFCEKIIREIES